MAPAATAPIPSSTEWGMIILSILLTLGAVVTLRRQRLYLFRFDIRPIWGVFFCNRNSPMIGVRY
ncbi:MAG: hypothetical protein ACLQHK_11045 [Gallionellaceae bacterium]